MSKKPNQVMLLLKVIKRLYLEWIRRKTSDKHLHIFTVAPCMLIILNHLFAQLMHTINYSKIVELLKTFKTTITAPTCFGLHKPSSGSSQSVLRQSYNIDFSVYMSLMEFSVLWVHILFCPVLFVYIMHCAE